MSKFYITTPIYYVNDVPHIGHAYTTIAADVLARVHRRLGHDVFFLTGTDEHGAKIAEAAVAAGLEPKAFCDRIVEHFKRTWRQLDISYDHFIRTTDLRHEESVRNLLSCLYERGYVYKGVYEGLYCVGCERFKTEEDLVNGKCPDHNREPIVYSEENYFFKLSAFRDRLLAALEDPNSPDYYEIKPATRHNEVVGKLRVGLSDLSISRAQLSWGIPLPFDPKQTTYVWVDALINYLSGVGYSDDSPTFERYWPADVHLMAKDILWFHAIIWPAMLMAAGVKPPKVVFAHGFFTVGGQKMSKTLGNFLPPAALVDRFGIDGARFLMLTEIPFGQDGDINLENFKARYNAQLANELGNLVNRVTSMIHRYFKGTVATSQRSESDVEELRKFVELAAKKAIERLVEIDFVAASETTREIVVRLNQFVEETQPWQLAKANRESLAEVLYALAEGIRICAQVIWPVMPASADKILTQLGLPPAPQSDPLPEVARWGAAGAGFTIQAAGEVLFPKIE